MKHVTIEVRATWDDEAKVWVASSADIDGLSVEAATLDALEPKILAAIHDLLELNGAPAGQHEIPVHIMAEQIAKVVNPCY